VTDRAILLLASNFPPVRGGSAVVYGNLARSLCDRVVVLAPRESYIDGLPLIGWREHDREAPYRIVRCRMLRTRINSGQEGRLPKLLFVISDLMIRLRVTSVLARMLLATGARTICVGELLAGGWILQLCRWLPLVRSVVYVHGEEITTRNAYDPDRRRILAALRAADRIVVVSRFTRGAVRALLGPATDAKTTLIENGLDTQRFRPLGKRADLVALYGLADRFVFVSVCRLVEKKGIDNTIRAFVAVRRRYRDCRYLVVGTGPYEAALRRIATEAGVAESVVFAGDVTEEDLVAHYCLGDAFVMPNRALADGDTEGFGLVFLEANGCGLPVIAGRDGGSRDAVQDGVNGLVVDGHSVAAIEAAMLALIGDAALRARLARQGWEVAAEADWRGRAAAFLAVCEGTSPVAPGPESREAGGVPSAQSDRTEALKQRKDRHDEIAPPC
jgi:phosphatidylinositol alpha-1,6-mannosyltransferase